MHISYKYIFERLKKRFTNYGFKGIFFSILNYINSRLNPKHLGEAPFKYLFLRKRRLIQNFAKTHLDKLNDVNVITLANYLVNEKLINSNSIIYTYGVGTSISFEEQISNKFNCDVYCYDPTILAKNFMKNHIYNKNKIKYFDYGIWCEDKMMKFYNQLDKENIDSGGSITNLFNNDAYDLLQCYRLETMMKKNNHDRVDVLKLDIEGAAIKVLDDILNSKIYPKQIIAEFECTENDNISRSEFDEWSLELINLLKKFRALNYKLFYLPRYSHKPFSTIEILFQK